MVSYVRRCVKQGDSLSAYLFTTVLQVFLVVMSDKETEGQNLFISLEIIKHIGPNDKANNHNYIKILESD